MRKEEQKVLDRARRTLQLEARAVEGMVRRLGREFLKAVDLLYRCRGRVVLTGVGKSGLIARKIASTLSSTGTPSIFINAAEAAHGDLGAVTPEDVVVAVSHSGETGEVGRLVPALRKAGVRIVSITGGRRSSLAAASDAVLFIGRVREACPLGLAPTTSSVATLAMGDALATALLEMRGFREEDFARLHPGGKLGKKWLRVSELMHRGKELPVVRPETPLLRAVCAMSAGKLGVAAVVGRRGKLEGVVTDGDLRRMIEREVDFHATVVGDVMTVGPRCIAEGEFAVQALRTMQEMAITSLMVTGDGGRLVGLIHMHDLLRAGIV